LAAASVPVPNKPTGTDPGTTSSPGPILSSRTVTLDWSSVSGATYYEVGVKDIASGTLVVDTQTSSSRYTTTLAAGRQYRWNVAAGNSAGLSSYTTPLYFQTPSDVAIPSKPTGTDPGTTSSPGPTLSSRTVTLDWGSVSGATYYEVGVTDMATEDLVVDDQTSSSSYTTTLDAGKTYRWNVAAGNSAGLSGYTERLYFQTPGGTVSLTDEFDYPIGNKQAYTENNDGDGWYNAQDFGDYYAGYGYHLGEDWNAESGGNTDLGSPVYAVANGTIVSAAVGTGWGNVIIVRHTLPDSTQVESMYAHLDTMLKTSGNVTRGEQIGTIGTGAVGGTTYSAHLHFEIRTSDCPNWGTRGSGYSTTPSATGWTDPSDFLDANRPDSTTYTISTSSSPSAGGTTGGGGSKASGSSCTVSASANSGYTFVNWTESGSQVSTRSSYTFSVNGNRTLVANFTATGGVVVPITPDFIPLGRNNRPAYPLTVTYITIHDTDNPNPGANAQMHAIYLKNADEGEYMPNNPIKPKSWHFTVDDHEIYQHLPLNENGWHAGDGDGPGNRQSIGIETCMNSDGNRTQAEENAAWLTAKLLNDFGLSLAQVKQHYDWSGKDCPSVLRGRVGGWEEFLARVAFYKDSGSTYYTISTSSSPSAGGTTGGGGSKESGSSCMVTASANSGYTFSNWTEDGGQVSTSSSYTFTVNGDRALVANFTATDSTDPSISAFSVSPSSVTLGSGFTANYTVSDSGGLGLKQVELFRADIDGTEPDPSWERISTIPLSGNGPVSGIFPADIPPDVGNYWYGIHVKDDAGNWITESDAGFDPIQRTVTASSYTIIPSAGSGGSISPNVTLSKPAESSQLFTAYPAPNYVVNQWKVDGNVVQSGGSSYTLSNIQAGHTVQVTFTYVPPSYTITVSVGSGGSISPNVNLSKPAGSSQLFTADPAPNYVVNQWKVDGGVVQSGGNSYTLSNIQANRSVQVLFKVKTYTVTPIASVNGTVSPATAKTVNSGGSASFTANPDSGCKFKHWLVDGEITEVGRKELTLNNITSDMTVEAVFEKNKAMPWLHLLLE